VAGNVFVIGLHELVWNPELTIGWLMKYDPDGEQQWLVELDSVPSPWPSAVATDADGNVLVTGVAAQRQGTTAWVGKYTAQGEQLWVRTYRPDRCPETDANGVAVDPEGNVLVVGTLRWGLVQGDVMVLKYSPDGEVLWTRTYAGPAGSHDQARAIATDPLGNVAAVATVTGENGDADRNIWVRKYAPDGRDLWTRTYDSPAHEADCPRSVAMDRAGSVVVGGDVGREDLGQMGNTWVRKYGP